MSASETVLTEPLEVKVNGNFERAMKAFRAIVQKEKVLSDFKEASRYEKPSDKKRRKQNEAHLKRLEEQGFYKHPKISKKEKEKQQPKKQEVHELVLAELHLDQKIAQRASDRATKNQSKSK